MYNLVYKTGDKNMEKIMYKKMKNVFDSAISAQTQISKLSSKEKATLEKGWDIEHAYYSSSLEGSNVDRKDFEKMAKKIV